MNGVHGDLPWRILQCLLSHGRRQQKWKGERYSSLSGPTQQKMRTLTPPRFFDWIPTTCRKPLTHTRLSLSLVRRPPAEYPAGALPPLTLSIPPFQRRNFVPPLSPGQLPQASDSLSAFVTSMHFNTSFHFRPPSLDTKLGRSPPSRLPPMEVAKES